MVGRLPGVLSTKNHDFRDVFQQTIMNSKIFFPNRIMQLFRHGLSFLTTWCAADMVVDVLKYKVWNMPWRLNTVDAQRELHQAVCPIVTFRKGCLRALFSCAPTIACINHCCAELSWIQILRQYATSLHTAQYPFIPFMITPKINYKVIAGGPQQLSVELQLPITHGCRF